MPGLWQLALDFLAPEASLAPFLKQNQPQVGVDVEKIAPETGAFSGFPPHPLANRQALLAGTRVGFHLRRARRRSIGFLVGPEGLTVSAPTRVPLHAIDAAVQEKAGWILRKLVEMAGRRQAVEARRIAWASGVELPYLGGVLRVVADATRARGAAFGPGIDDGVPELRLAGTATPEALRDGTRAWLQKQARGLFAQRLDHFAPSLGVRWTGLALSSAATRWGSANSRGGIRLNWRLMHLPPELIDYVVVHELAHLRVMDHSPRFWAVVATAMPDHEARRRALKSAAVPPWD